MKQCLEISQFIELAEAGCIYDDLGCEDRFSWRVRILTDGLYELGYIHREYVFDVSDQLICVLVRTLKRLDVDYFCFIESFVDHFDCGFPQSQEIFHHSTTDITSISTPIQSAVNY